MTEKDLEEFLTLQKTKAESEHSWLLDVSTLGDDYDLSVKNPNKVEEVDERTPQEIANSIVELNEMNQNLLNEILALL
jgi:type I restriction enzyme M protein